MTMPNIPRFVWVIIWIAILLIVLALLKFDLSIGSGGISISQHLVR